MPYKTTVFATFEFICNLNCITRFDDTPHWHRWHCRHMTGTCKVSLSSILFDVTPFGVSIFGIRNGDTLHDTIYRNDSDSGTSCHTVCPQAKSHYSLCYSVTPCGQHDRYTRDSVVFHVIVVKVLSHTIAFAIPCRFESRTCLHYHHLRPTFVQRLQCVPHVHGNYIAYDICKHRSGIDGAIICVAAASPFSHRVSGVIVLMVV